MPQEIALIMEFTILETIRFFGKLHGMKQQQLQERTNFLLKFLDLPDGNRLVRDLRLVSCVCMFNELVDINNYIFSVLLCIITVEDNEEEYLWLQLLFTHLLFLFWTNRLLVLILF